MRKCRARRVAKYRVRVRCGGQLSRGYLQPGGESYDSSQYTYRRLWRQNADFDPVLDGANREVARSLVETAKTRSENFASRAQPRDIPQKLNSSEFSSHVGSTSPLTISGMFKRPAGNDPYRRYAPSRTKARLQYNRTLSTVTDPTESGSGKNGQSFQGYQE